MKQNNEKIDFVITWVDGSDPIWQAEKEKYDPHQKNNSASENRFRDWGLMRYWFRGVEKYAPWVNHIYFVTCGHYPEWLNLNHSGLTLVRHEDYIPMEYLPTFNSNVIELFIYRFSNLSEHFVLFNDDTFLIAPTKPDDFFHNGAPCDSAVLDNINARSPDDIFPHIVLNNTSVINKYFSKKEVMSKQRAAFLCPKYGREVIKNLLLWYFKYFSGFRDSHLPASHLKSIFQDVWDKESDLLMDCASHRFRSKDDLSHWLMKQWMICQGKIFPRSYRWGKHFELGADNRRIYDAIRKQRYISICLNDSSDEIDFEKTREQLTQVFMELLPEKSSYEY